MKIVVCGILAAALVFPQGKTEKAHVHGSAQLSIAMDGNKGEVELEAPADGILGFESEAKTPAQKRAVESALATLRTRANELVLFPPASACKLTPKEIDIHREGPQHAEVHAHYDLSCSKSITGEIRFGVTKLFPRTRQVKVTFISDKSQKGATISSDVGSIQP